MTVFELESALVEFIEANTSELRYRSNEQTDDEVAPQVRSGFIPRDEVGAIIPGDITVYPAVIVNAQSGAQSSADDAELVTVNILIGIFDDGLNQQGYRDCCNLLQRIKDRIREVDIIRERFPWRPPLNWQLNKKYGGPGTNSYPYFFAELQVNFALPAMTSQFDTTAGDGDVEIGRYNEDLLVPTAPASEVQQAPWNPSNTYG